MMEWINVTDRLPEDFNIVEETYIVCSRKATCKTTAYFEDGKFYPIDADGQVVLADVTHWMPLPEPPMGVKNDKE